MRRAAELGYTRVVRVRPFSERQPLIIDRQALAAVRYSRELARDPYLSGLRALRRSGALSRGAERS